MVSIPNNAIVEEIDSQEKQLLKLLISVTRIPSPTGLEKNKIQFIKKYIQDHGIETISIDTVGNCIVQLPSKSNNVKKTILVVAHADTACDSGETVSVKEDEKYIYGHGSCDNSSGITALLTTLVFIKRYNLQFPHNLIIAFTVGEEGLGAKRGMKQIINQYGKQIDAVINVESHPIGRLTNQVVGQYRGELVINIKTGGHSFRDFGKPNANVILSNVITDFSRTAFPQTKGKTTFNFAQLKGDGSINALSSHASCLFEIRSEDNQQLQKAIDLFSNILKDCRKQFPTVEIHSTVSAHVPAVIFPKKHKIYQLTQEVQKILGITPQFTSGNTDGDVSLAAGIPTVTIGTSNGGNTHSLDEYMERKSLTRGIKQAFLTIYTIASRF